MSTPTPRDLYNNVAALEPLFPTDKAGELRELAADLMRKSARLGGALHPVTRRSVVELLRTMNSYYSNLIEGHNTHPLAIEKALRNDYSTDPALRALQIESRAHIEVQILIERRLEENPLTEVSSKEFLCWIHREFYERLPDEFRTVKTANGGYDQVTPGTVRSCEVEVGRHIPPTFSSLGKFLDRFATGYTPNQLDPLQRIVAAAASHHRLAWIHPFLDGNGRVTRLFTHAFFIHTKTDGHRLWMVSRGLARRRSEYLDALASADRQRRNDLDGRGNLSDEGLAHFCRFFLNTAMDQVEFMTGLLDLDAMQDRILFSADKRTLKTKEADRTPDLLRDLFLRGEMTRGEATRILQKPERTARRVLSGLQEEGLIASDAPGAPVRLGFPTSLVGYYFPRLYPEGVELEGIQRR
ncbi:MAG: Fic family protein [Verrucomicrobiota bacterium]